MNMKNNIIYIFSTFIIISCGGNYSGNEDTVLRSIKSPLFLVTDDKNVYKSNDAENWNSYSLTFTNSTSLNYFNKSFILTGMNGDGENLSFQKTEKLGKI